MTWEKRKRGGLYYTRSKKVNGRVIREYVGGGIVGELGAHMDVTERHHREEKAAFWKEEREQLEALEAPVEELCEAVELLAKAALVAAGFHQHKRGQWRKRRGNQNSKD